jgi:ABC-type transport system involved in cytochrome c biogenesis permease subunit
VAHTQVMAFWFAYLLYAGGFVCFAYFLFSRRELQERIGLACVTAGWLLETVALAARWAEAGRVPVVGGYESMVALSWAIVAVYLVLEWRTRVKALGLYVMPAALVFMTIGWGRYAPPAHLVPALKSDLVVIHVSVIFAALAAFLVAGGAALIYVIEDIALKRRHIGPVLGRLPALRTLDQLVGHAVMTGLPFLSMGIAAGVIRAEAFGVEQWWRNAVVALAVIAWAIYAGFVYARLVAGWAGRRTAWLAIAGLVCLLAIRLVAEPYLSGFHVWGK